MRFDDAEPILRDNLLALARAYAQARGVKMATLSNLAYGEAPFFDMLIEQDRAAKAGQEPGRKGSFTVRKYDRVRRWFTTHWPEDVPMPKLKATPGVRDVSSRRTGPVRGRAQQREAAPRG